MEEKIYAARLMVSKLADACKEAYDVTGDVPTEIHNHYRQEVEELARLEEMVQGDLT